MYYPIVWQLGLRMWYLYVCHQGHQRILWRDARKAPKNLAKEITKELIFLYQKADFSLVRPNVTWQLRMKLHTDRPHLMTKMDYWISPGAKRKAPKTAFSHTKHRIEATCVRMWCHHGYQQRREGLPEAGGETNPGRKRTSPRKPQKTTKRLISRWCVRMWFDTPVQKIHKAKPHQMAKTVYSISPWAKSAGQTQLKFLKGRARIKNTF